MAPAGEYTYALEEFFATLRALQIPVTPAQRDTLRALLEYLRKSTDDIDRLVVEPAPDSPK